MKSISRNHILLSYITLPLGLLVIVLDNLFFSRSIQQILPGDPHELFIINLFFGLPHIVAGDIQLLDREYISYHKIALLLCVAFSLAFPMTIIFQYGMATYIIIEYVVSAFHAAGQQLGIVGMFSKFNRDYYQVWKWSSRIALSLTALRMVRIDIFGPYFESYLDDAVIVLLAANLLSGLHMIKNCDQSIGRVYIALNIGMTYSFYLFHLWGYSALSILTLRVPHDITAFLFYMNHSQIRNEETPKNWIVKLLRIPNRAGGYFLPLFAVPVALMIEQWQVLFMFDAFLSYMHFTSETFIWKANSPHLKHIRVG